MKPAGSAHHKPVIFIITALMISNLAELIVRGKTIQQI
jgi:hypothetical protein